MSPTLSMIAAIAHNNVIGKNNTLPWHIPADLKHFKQLTLKKALIMGRKTHESIGKALPDRLNIILTRDRTYQAAGCIIVHSAEDAIAKARAYEEIMIIGGSEIYREFLPKVHKMYLTFIDATIAGDTFFPTWNDNEWQEISREEHAAGQGVPGYRFVELTRIKTA